MALCEGPFKDAAVQGRVKSLGGVQLMPCSSRRLSSGLRRQPVTASATQVDTGRPAPGTSPSQRMHQGHVSDGTSTSSSSQAPQVQAFEAHTQACYRALDGNEAAARIAYMMSDVAFIYPITPSTPMSELAELWASEGKTNIFGNVMSVTEMEGEAGVAGALHGAVAAGALATSFSCSQGLLLMIPNMYKIAGELSPCTVHIASRALSRHAVSMYGDHQDVMAVRQTGWAMLCSGSVQEAQDMALVAHLATLRSSVPFLHFFDGFRTSHEVSKISLISDADVKRIAEQQVYQDAIHQHQQAALSPMHPHQRGTAQGSDVYFQAAEAANPFYQACPDHVLAAMADVESVTGRPYRLFEYVGHPQADRVVVLMGSGCEVAEEAVTHLADMGHKVGMVKVRLFRPWSAEHLIAALPPTATRIAVLDRTKEAGSAGEPLFLDVQSAIAEHDDVTRAPVRRTVVGGRYGLASKEFTPGMVATVLENLALPYPKRHFTVGIVDDVSYTSLPLGPELHTLPPGTHQCMFWGLGSDGTVGANKDAIKIIAENTNLCTQAYFEYDAHKSGGLTISHLRFSPSPIHSSYGIHQADYLGVHHANYMQRFDVLGHLKPGGTLVLNTTYSTVEQLEQFLPNMVKRKLAQLHPSFYIIDAHDVAHSVGLSKHVNMVMQSVFFHMCGVLPVERALSLLKASIAKTYASKGPEVVANNQAAVDVAGRSLRRIAIPPSWSTLDSGVVPAQSPVNAPSFSGSGAGASQHVAEPAGSHDESGVHGSGRLRFIEQVAKPMLALEGNKLPVSVFSPTGIVPPGTTCIERRAVASSIPSWHSGACTQCNICSFVCPHAAIRPFLAKPEELQGAPQAFETIPAKGPGLQGFRYRMQVSAVDCTGCQLCVSACPDKALSAVPLRDVLSIEDVNWSFGSQLPKRSDLMNRNTVKGSQLMSPLMEFNGACEGCGEPAYVKLLTQLFGERLIVANASGCSSVWGGYAPSNPFTTNSDGYGPAWASSLFEDNAQFGLGIAMAVLQRRRTLHRHVEATLAEGDAVPMTTLLRDRLTEWSKSWQQVDACNLLTKEISSLLDRERGHHPALEQLWHERDQLLKPSIWIVGGDGWAYDIGFGGLDHVLSTGEDINILVLDNELYANTGGQKSKSTPLGAVAKFAAGGKQRPKKDLGAIAMTYGDVYVASTNLEASYGQVVKAMSEAERYSGVSLVMGYVPCIAHGIKQGMCNAGSDAKEATECFYWPLYRYRPDVADGEGNGQHRFQLDSKHMSGALQHFIHNENRFTQLEAKQPEDAQRLHHDLELMAQERQLRLKHLAEADEAPPPHGLHQIEEMERRSASRHQ